MRHVLPEGFQSSRAEEAHILIVDDEPTVRSVLELSLRDHGYRCYQAGNSAEAKGLLAQRPFDVCFIDVHMPGESGIDLLVHLRCQAPDAIPIMLTGVHDANLAVTAMKLGAYDYVTKPFTPHDLIHRLQQALEKRRLLVENRLYREKLERLVEERTQQLQERNRQLERLMLGTIESFTLALQLRSEYTEGHSERVAYWCVKIAEEMGLSTQNQLALYHAALMHDMGKMAIRDSILNKTGSLTSDEYREMQRHPAFAYDILHPIASVIDGFLAVVEGILYHHEHYDGSGYPEGLRGEEIPLFARIISVADAYDSMVSPRPYRPNPHTPREAIEELKRSARRQLDPEIVEAFIRCYQRDKRLSVPSSAKMFDQLLSHEAEPVYLPKILEMT